MVLEVQEKPDELDQREAELRKSAEEAAGYTEPTILEGINTEDQRSRVRDDPRLEEDGGGFRGFVKELQSIGLGGLQDTASSFATFPERAVDMVSGEMQRERQETGTYRPEWSPFTDYENPIVTKTWWGKLLRGVVHFGTTAGAITAAAGAAGISAPASLAGMAGYSLLRAAAIGATSDLISKESDGHNALAMLRDHYGFIDTPLSTKDTDHPVWMKFKNIVEGMGIGLVFDGATILLGKGSKGVRAQVDARKKSVDVQEVREGLQQLRKNEFGASKNPELAGPHQGNHISEVSPGKAREQLKRTRTEWDAEDGSTGSVTTAVQRERVGSQGQMTDDMVESILRGLYSDQKFKAEMAEIKAGNKTLMEVYGDAVEAHQRILLGRNAAEMSATEFLEEMYRSSIKYDVTDAAGDVVDTIETWTTKNIVVGDLLVGSLLKQLRDQGIAGRELKDFVNLIDEDGPAKQIFDTMMTAMTEVKRARAYSSDSFRQIGAGKRQLAVEEAVTADMKDTRDAILSILQIAKEPGNDDLLNAAFELFSSMKTVNNLDDFDAWARKMIKGGSMDPSKPDRTGALIREMQGMMVHSILSGPKTPLRAIMGTSTATFLRPMQQFLGATMRLPFTGDVRTIRSSLASMNAMMQAIPESFTLFRSKLDGYWSGDISSIKTRFSEFTRGDDNWELLRRYYEDSGRATVGDQALFSMANMARNANNTNLFTYSTKIMAATDDSFRYILGRAKMREKAMLSAMDAEKKGLIPDITPELMAVYEEDFYRQIFDADGNIIDEATKFAAKEVTLTNELEGFSKGLNDVFTASPMLKPFFLFARTGVNGLALTAKHTPGFNFLVKEFNDIAFAKASNLQGLEKYGITNAQELINAKALQTGRFGMGCALVFTAIQSYLAGNLTGDGPLDRQTRQMWIDTGWKANSAKAGSLWVKHLEFEPFGSILSTVANIGDASMLMGEEWTEDQFQKTALIIGQAVTSKSYMQSMGLFVDILTDPRQLANLANPALSLVPLQGARKALGEVVTPYMRELDSSIASSVRNRNKITEGIAAEPLAIKYNWLDGKPVKDWKFLTRLANAVLPGGVALEGEPGVDLIHKAMYDQRLSVNFAPDGTDLSAAPAARSLFQEAIGKFRPIDELNRLAKNPKIIASINQMNEDRKSGYRGDFEPMDYYHNKVLAKVLDGYREKGWQSILNSPVIAQLREEQAVAAQRRKFKQWETGYNKTTTASLNDTLNMYK